MQEVLIRGIDFETKEEVHDFLAQELSFPDYYGANLDALYDVLTDLTEETHITIDTYNMENADMYDYFLRLEEVLLDASRENPCLEVEVL